MEDQDDQIIQGAETPGAGQSYADLYGIGDDGAIADPAAAVAVETPAPVEEPAAEDPGAVAPVASGEFANLIAQLKAAGLGGDDAIEGLLAQQQTQQAMEAELGTLWEDLQARIDSGEVTPEIAQMLYEAKAQNLELSAQAQVQAAQAEKQQAAQSMQALAQIDPALGQLAQQAGFTPQQSQALAEALQPLLGKTKQAAVSQYVADKTSAGGGSATAPIPAGASATPVPGNVDVDVKSISFEDAFRLDGARF